MENKTVSTEVELLLPQGLVSRVCMVLLISMDIDIVVPGACGLSKAVSCPLVHSMVLRRPKARFKARSCNGESQACLSSRIVRWSYY